MNTGQMASLSDPVMEKGANIGETIPKDVSQTWVKVNSDLKNLSSPIKLKHFSSELKKRNLQIEFKIIELITQTKEHINKLYKDPIQFGLNRYETILPYEYNLVQIRSSPEDSEYYINANYIKGGLPDCTYIATQAPMKNTINHFWKMVELNNITRIVMLCSAQEKCKIQSFRYWPIEEDPDWSIEAGDYKIILRNVKQLMPKLVQKHFTIINRQTKKEINIVHYKLRGWNDNEAPQGQSAIALQQLLEISLEALLDKHKILVHCSAGVGRTGSFIALLNLKSELHLYRRNNDQKTVGELEISIFNTVRQLRQQRWGMVYRRDQYVFLYHYINKQINEKVLPPSTSQ